MCCSNPTLSSTWQCKRYHLLCTCGVLFDFQHGETNIRSGVCWVHATNANHEMNSWLSCIPFKLSSQLTTDCQTCTNAAKSQEGNLMQTSQWMNCCFSCLPPLLSSSLSLSLLPWPGWNQVVKQRLQRLLRPQKEEKKSKQQASTVATVGLEEIKAKVQHTLYCNKWHLHYFHAKRTTFPTALLLH